MIKLINNLLNKLSMKKVIEHLSKLISCEKIIYTGSFPLSLMGLTEKVKDLDVIVVNPSDDTLLVLDRLHVPYIKTDYPKDPRQFRIVVEGVSVDIWVDTKTEECLEVNYDGTVISIAKINNIIKAKKRYKRLKDIMQLKTMAEKFYKPEELATFLKVEQSKY